MMRPILVGDVGGTKLRFALANSELGHITINDVQIYNDPDIPSLEDGIARYLSDTGAKVDAALFALAGPLAEDGSIQLTNRAWPRIVPDKMKDKLGLARAQVVNDFAAMARSVPEIGAEHFEPIIESHLAPKAPILVTGPGTGMGVSTLLPIAGGWRVLTGEGGHARFAPCNDREAEIRDHLAKTHDYVSVEMIVSGRWLIPVYEAICALQGEKPETLSPQEILEKAEAGDAVAVETVKFRANALMGAIGDAALITGARGGVVLTGGVAERIINWLRSPEAINRFHERGQMSGFLSHTPVSVLKHSEAPLIGAAALALEMES